MHMAHVRHLWKPSLSSCQYSTMVFTCIYVFKVKPLLKPLGTDSRRTLSTVCRRLRPLLYLGLYLFLLVYRCWAPRHFWFSASYISVYRIPRKYFCCAFVPEGLFAVLGNFRIIHTVVAWNWSNQVLLFLLNQSVKKAEFISWTGNPDKTGLGKNFYCSKDLVFRHYRLE